jgi:hypothetical protein
MARVSRLGDGRNTAVAISFGQQLLDIALLTLAPDAARTILALVRMLQLELTSRQTFQRS